MRIITSLEMRRIAIILLLTLLVGCYNNADKPIITDDLPAPNATVAQLRSEILGTRPRYISEDVVIVGRIISSDSDSNFYRSIVVDDGTGGVEVLMGVSPLAADYPEGLNVALRLKGCYVGYMRGVVVVGTKAAEYESMDVGYLASPEAIDRVVVRGGSVEIVEPRTKNIASLTRDECGRLIRIEGLTLAGSTSIDTLQSETLHDACWRGYAIFRDAVDDSVAIYTRDYARYAEELIPHDKLSLTGILQWARYDGGEECYQLKMRYATDCEIRR